MGYIALIVAVIIGGGVALYNGWEGNIPGIANEPINITAPIKVAEDAVEAMEKLSVGESSTVSDAAPASDLTADIPAVRLETMLVAGGCFWCVEADLEKLPGVIQVVSGYAGGSGQNPNYQNYASGGHREVVEVSYDPDVVSFEQILVYAMKHMDPTDDDGSFGDRGEYYSPAFYYKTPAEKSIIENLITDVDANGPYEKPLAIDVEVAQKFFAAEDYHQDYYKGTVSQLKYQYYRTASGRDAYIKKIWGSNTGATLPWRTVSSASQDGSSSVSNNSNTNKIAMWKNYVKPSKDLLKTQMEASAFSVTQTDGTERAGTNPLDKNYERGIYVDILSGEPLFSSKDKFDSGTGWPSFVKPISGDAVTEHVDKSFFSTRTEVRSRIADNHLGHVFPDGPQDRGGLRYCMNGVALRFVSESEMAATGYSDFLGTL